MPEKNFGIRDIVPNNIRDNVPNTKNSYFQMSSTMSLIPKKKNVPNTEFCVLCYLFNTNELTNVALKNTKEETAQYSLHVVGLVINRLNNTIIIADPNGAFIGESNMEFISMPLDQ